MCDQGWLAGWRWRKNSSLTAGHPVGRAADRQAAWERCGYELRRNCWRLPAAAISVVVVVATVLCDLISESLIGIPARKADSHRRCRRHRPFARSLPCLPVTHPTYRFVRRRLVPSLGGWSVRVGRSRTPRGASEVFFIHERTTVEF